MSRLAIADIQNEVLVLRDLDGNELSQWVLNDGAIPEPDPGTSDWTDFVPQLRVGASGGKYAGLGNGLAMGWYKTRQVGMGALGSTAEEVELFVDMTMINPTIPDGEGFEIEVPARIQPADANYSRGGCGDLWIMGGSNSHSISPKWTDRNDRGMRILILGSGWEWTTNVPKAIPVKATEKSMGLFFWMKYLKQA